MFWLHHWTKGVLMKYFITYLCLITSLNELVTISFVDVFRKQVKPLILWIIRKPPILGITPRVGKDFCPKKLF